MSGRTKTTKEFRLTFTMEEAGWARARLQTPKGDRDFTISYLCDPLADLLDCVNELHRSYDAAGLLADGSSYDLEWKGEPWHDDLTFTPQEGRTVGLRVQSFVGNGFDGPDQKTQPDLRCTVSLDALMRQVFDQAEAILKGYGFLGYRRNWISTDFPIGNFLTLRDNLGLAPGEPSLAAEVRYLAGLL